MADPEKFARVEYDTMASMYRVCIKDFCIEMTRNGDDARNVMNQINSAHSQAVSEAVKKAVEEERENIRSKMLTAAYKPWQKPFKGAIWKFIVSFFDDYRSSSKEANHGTG